MRQTFEQDEAEKILLEAVRRADEIEIASVASPPVTVETLSSMAEELGVSPEILASVLDERKSAVAVLPEAPAATKSQQAYIEVRRAALRVHFWSYLAINTALIGAWLASGGNGPFWPMAPLVFWGFILAIHAALALPTRGPEFDRALAAWQAKREPGAQVKKSKD